MTWHHNPGAVKVPRVSVPKPSIPKPAKPAAQPKPAPVKPLTKGGTTGTYDAKKPKMGTIKRGKI